MITSAILFLIYTFIYVVSYPLRLFGNVSVETGVGSAVATASTYLGTLDKFFPVDTILTILGLIFSIEIIIALYKGILWIIKRVKS